MQNLKNLRDKITDIEGTQVVKEEETNVDNSEILKETLRKLKDTQKKKVVVNVNDIRDIWIKYRWYWKKFIQVSMTMRHR